MEFAALDEDFSSLSLDTLGSRRAAQTGVKEGYSGKKW